ncbi:MAG: CsgG/HfaB family protein [Thermoguttaceae bacterium]|jgi:TolB-like protein
MKTLSFYIALSIVVILSSGLPARAADKDEKRVRVYPAAVLPFQERGRDVKDQGSKVTDLLFAQLAADPSLMLVDREDIHKVLAEHELNLSGLVNPEQATKVGQLTGAKLLITGSVLQVDGSLYLVAKIIGTETSRVVGASVKGSVRDDLGKLVEDLGKEISKTVVQRADDLVAKPVSRDDRIAALKKKLGDGKRPTVSVRIPERHVMALIQIDPAAETEIGLFCKETGFKLIDPKEGSKKEIDIRIEGEALSEFAVRAGNLISVKARVEVKAIDQATGQIVAVDRQTTVAVDLTEQIAAKTALQEAGALLAERMLPKLVTRAPAK